MPDPNGSSDVENGRIIGLNHDSLQGTMNLRDFSNHFSFNPDVISLVKLCADYTYEYREASIK